ncbi:MAG: STAS domain-containing protein [Planctomycetes bacterium]|nr:STAS domain-containing protein [Planctomycetota bacterium]
MASKRRLRMTIYERDGVTVMNLGAVEIWDGADLSLLRDTLTRLIEQDGLDSIGVDMTHVKYIPSGFFGMLYDWHEHGIDMRLYTPQPNVAAMLWFRKFFEHEGDGSFVLHSEPLDGPQTGDWSDEDWSEQDDTVWESVGATSRR